MCMTWAVLEGVAVPCPGGQLRAWPCCAGGLPGAAHPVQRNAPRARCGAPHTASRHTKCSRSRFWTEMSAASPPLAARRRDAPVAAARAPAQRHSGTAANARAMPTRGKLEEACVCHLVGGVPQARVHSPSAVPLTPRPGQGEQLRSPILVVRASLPSPQSMLFTRVSTCFPGPRAAYAWDLTKVDAKRALMKGGVTVARWRGGGWHRCNGDRRGPWVGLESRHAASAEMQRRGGRSHDSQTGGQTRLRDAPTHGLHVVLAAANDCHISFQSAAMAPAIFTVTKSGRNSPQVARRAASGAWPAARQRHDLARCGLCVRCLRCSPRLRRKNYAWIAGWAFSSQRGQPMRTPWTQRAIR